MNGVCCSLENQFYVNRDHFVLKQRKKTISSNVKVVFNTNKKIAACVEYWRVVPSDLFDFVTVERRLKNIIEIQFYLEHIVPFDYKSQ